MATVKTFRQFYLILLLYINLPMNTAEVVIALKLMAPILNTKFYVLCDITVSTEEEEEVKFLDKDVIIESKNLKCTISGWKFCHKPPPPQVHGACGCSFKTSVPGGFKYRFYLLINPVSEDYGSSQFICQLDTVKDSRQMNVIMFTKSPERIVYRCKNTSAVFNWEFNPSRETIKERFNIIRISWTQSGSTIALRHVGSFYISESGKKQFTNNGNFRFSEVNETERIPKLKMSNIQLADSGEYITINVTFNLTKMLDRRKRLIPIKDNGFLSFDRNNDTDDGGEVTADDNSTASTVVIKTQTSTTETTRPTQPTTTTPMPRETILDNPDNRMVDTIQLIVTEPPSHDTKVSIKAYESLTGNLVISCTIEGMTYHGAPPVNVTIWLDKKRLITRSGITVLHYSTVAEGKSISCGLEGHALDCVEKGDPRLEQASFDLKDLEKSEKPTESLDILLSLYAWESIICIVLLLWVTSLLLDHILFVVRKTKQELEATNKALLEAEMNRQIVVARIKT